MTVYRMKLTDFEIRALIGVLYEYHREMKQNGNQSETVDNLLLRIIDEYEKR